MCNMNRYDWNRWIDAEAAKRRAGGRRRYNAQRRRRAEARREAIAEFLEENIAAVFFSRGLPAALAPAFGVHPSTIWRDLQLILRGGRIVHFYREEEHLFSVTQAYSGGRILSVTDPDGNEIRGKARKDIIRSLPRYFG